MIWVVPASGCTCCPRVPMLGLKVALWWSLSHHCVPGTVTGAQDRTWQKPESCSPSWAKAGGEDIANHPPGLPRMPPPPPGCLWAQLLCPRLHTGDPHPLPLKVTISHCVWFHAHDAPGCVSGPRVPANPDLLLGCRAGQLCSSAHIHHRLNTRPWAVHPCATVSKVTV